MAKELALRDVSIKSQVPVELYYKEESLGKGYVIDILVEECIVIEVKAVETMHSVYQAQLITYLKLSNRKLGYLINFNVPLLKDGFKRIVYNF